MTAKEKDVRKLIKRCLGMEPPSYLVPELERIVKIRRVELFPPNYGLSRRGTPDGGFYTFVNDRTQIQKFMAATHKIFFPLETPSIIGELFPKDCYAQLSFLTDESWTLLPVQELSRLTPSSKKTIGGYIFSNGSSWSDLQGCYSPRSNTRVGVNLFSIDSSGNFIRGRSFSLVISPGKKPEITIIDPDSSKGVNYHKIIDAITQRVGIKDYREGEPIHQRVCKKLFRGQEALCSTWSMFLILTEIMNPPSWWPRIEEEFSNMEAEDLVKILYQFAWWFIKMFGDVIYQESEGREITYIQLIKLFRVEKPVDLPEVKDWV